MPSANPKAAWLYSYPWNPRNRKPRITVASSHFSKPPRLSSKKRLVGEGDGRAGGKQNQGFKKGSVQGLKVAIPSGGQTGEATLLRKGTLA